jgi:hypothetical protein
LYTALSAVNREKNGVYVGDLGSNERKLVIGFGTRAIYAAPGDLLFLRERTLMAQSFNMRTLETTGEAAPIAEQVDAGVIGDVFGLSVSNSSSGGDWELDEAPAVRDPAHMVQIGRDRRAPTCEGQRLCPSNDAWPRAAL